MNTRNLLRNLLLIFAVGSVLYFVAKEIAGARATSGPATPAPSPPGADPVLIVYYLSEGKDCATCNNLEAYTLETLRTYFSADLASGRILWQSLDMDEAQHKHFVTDFSLYTKSVVLVEMQDDRQVRRKNLEDIWDYVYDKPAFIEFIRAEVSDFLGQTS